MLFYTAAILWVKTSFVCDNGSLNATFNAGFFIFIFLFFLQNYLIPNYRLHTMIWQTVLQVPNEEW